MIEPIGFYSNYEFTRFPMDSSAKPPCEQLKPKDHVIGRYPLTSNTHKFFCKPLAAFAKFFLSLKNPRFSVDFEKK